MIIHDEDLDDHKEADAADVERLLSRVQRIGPQELSVNLSGAYPKNNGSDPFYCTVAGNEAYIHYILFHAFSSLARSTFLAEAFAPSSLCQGRTQMRHNETIMERLRRCVDDDMLMYSTLAYGSSCLAWALGTMEDSKSPEYFIAKALPAVRARLSRHDKVDMWLLLSVYSLAITESWNGNPHMWTEIPSRHASALQAADHSRKACAIHLRALISLVDSIGGCNAIDPYVLESLVLLDKYFAISQWGKPILPLTWDPGQYIQLHPEFPEVQTSKLDRLGEGFAQVELCHELAGVVQDVVEYVRMAHRIWSCSNVTSKAEGWLFLHLQALIYPLISMDGLQGIDNCIRVATLLFLQNRIHYKGSELSVAIFLRHLRAALIDAKIAEEPCERDIFLWLLCTGAMATEFTGERDWYIDSLASFSNSLPFSWTAHALQDVLEIYLFIPEEQGCQLSGLIDSICARRGDVKTFGETRKEGLVLQT